MMETNDIILHTDDFITITWNQSKTFNVYFAIGDNGELKEMDCFSTMKTPDSSEAKEIAQRHANECNEILEE